MNVKTQHVVMFVSAALVAVFEAAAHFAQVGGQLPLHLTAATCLMISTYLGAISKSILEPQAPAGTNITPVATEVADQTATLLSELKSNSK